MAAASPQFEIVEFPNGTRSLRDSVSGQAMHSHIGPDREAWLLYVEQSQLRERLMSGGPGPLVLHDVGLGIAANALAAIRCALGAAEAAASRQVPPRRLEVHSFERTLAGLELAVAARAAFPFLSGFEAAVQELLATGAWEHPGGAVSWRLHAGDYRETLERAPAPELVYYDFYSPRSCPELWTTGIFEKLRERPAPPEAGITLYTYTAATAVRAALLLAGYRVGYGTHTDAKSSTTVASTNARYVANPLDSRWLARFDRSGKRRPHDYPGNDGTGDLARRVKSSSQFLLS